MLYVTIVEIVLKKIFLIYVPFWFITHKTKQCSPLPHFLYFLYRNREGYSGRIRMYRYFDHKDSKMNTTLNGFYFCFFYKVRKTSTRL